MDDELRELTYACYPDRVASADDVEQNFQAVRERSRDLRELTKVGAWLFFIPKRILQDRPGRQMIASCRENFCFALQSLQGILHF